jgi:hypothetical protein
MKETGWKKSGWESSSLAETHRVKSIRFLFNDDQDLWHSIFHHNMPPRLREESELFGESFERLSSDERILVRASLDFWNSTGDLLLWECLWGLDYLVLLRLIRAICHLREIQHEAIDALILDLD